LLGYGIAIASIERGAPSFLLPLFVGAGSILALMQAFRTAKLISHLPEESENSKNS
jgi:hypothetical protein